MKVKDLIGLGFKVEFQSIEQTGGRPYFYLRKHSEGRLLVYSGAADMNYDENEIEHYKKYLDKEVFVYVWDNLVHIPDEAVILLNQSINVMNESEKRQ
jgi:hypothetical protein